MADISKIKLGSTTYNIKDASAKHSVSTGDSVTVTAGTAATLLYTSRSIPNVTSVGTAPSLTYTARSIPNVTSVGTAPSLSYTAKSIPNVTAAGTASVSGNTLTITNTTLGTAIPADDITAWSAGTVPTLGTAIAADDITAWSAGTVPTLGTAISADDITAWTTNTPTAVTKKTVVTSVS